MRTIDRNPLLSVIVPVYNTAEYLRQCLESIIHQTYQNLEIILVADGGSTDGSTEICEEYATVDKRIKVLHQPHQFLGAARKKGAMVASGEYIACVDSDDWIDLGMYEKLLSAMGDLTPDILMFGFRREYAEKSVICTYRLPSGYYDENGIKEEIWPRLLKIYYPYQWEILHRYHHGMQSYNQIYQGPKRQQQQAELYPGMWSKIIKKDLFIKSSALVPDDVLLGEDLACTAQMIFRACSAMVVDMVLYHYRIRNESRARAGCSNNFYYEKILFRTLYSILLNQPLQDIYLNRLYHMFLAKILPYCYDSFLEGEFSDALFGKLDDCRVALYGAGKFGQEIYQKTKKVFPDRIVLWVDRQYEKYRQDHLPVDPVDELMNRDYDVVIVGIVDGEICKEIRHDLINMGIDMEKIRYASASPKVVEAMKKIMFE